MICIECAYPDIDCLYFKYKSEYIKLTTCPQCGKIADKYIEYDNVILFIDTLLLKPPAYRHLVYNVTEIELARVPSTHFIKGFIARYKKLLRLIVLIVLFEVYLTWAYEEKASTHSIAMEYILELPIYYQYSFFLFQSISQQIVLNGSVQAIYRGLLNWGSIPNKNLLKKYQNGYFTSVLLLTVLVAGSIKLFPILMLIWPYDNTSISGPIIDLIGFINMIEALTIVTRSSYVVAFLALLVSTINQLVVSKLTSSVIVWHFSGISFDTILKNEYAELLHSVHSYSELGRGIIDAFK